MDSFCDSRNIVSLWSRSGLNFLVVSLALQLCVLFHEDVVYEGISYQMEF